MIKHSQLFLIGGKEEKIRHPGLLKDFLHFTKPDSRILLITGASSIPFEQEKVYSDIFMKEGALAVNTIPFLNRSDGNCRINLQFLEECDGIFITGGNQVKLASRILGTEFHSMLLKKIEDGIIYCGTSAGASIVSQLMIAGGRGAYNPRRSTVKLSGGLGIISNCIIDQHFRERNRLFRLATAIAANPDKIGIGIDENTAVYIKDNNTCFVTGANSVTIIDGSQLKYSGYTEGTARDPIPLVGLKVHSLPSGWAYDIQSQQVADLRSLKFPEDFIKLQEEKIKWV